MNLSRLNIESRVLLIELEKMVERRGLEQAHFNDASRELLRAPL